MKNIGKIKYLFSIQLLLLALISVINILNEYGTFRVFVFISLIISANVSVLRFVSNVKIFLFIFIQLSFISFLVWLWWRGATQIWWNTFTFHYNYECSLPPSGQSVELQHLHSLLSPLVATLPLMCLYPKAMRARKQREGTQ